MIQIKRTPILSAKTVAAFGPHSRDEWRQLRSNRQFFYQTSHRLWTLYHDGYPVCVIGLRRFTWLGNGGEIYFLLCKHFNQCSRWVIRFLRRAIRRVVRCLNGLVVKVEKGFWVGEKFVKHFGFRKAGEFQANGVEYGLYELRPSWV